ncbi:MAG TPA: SMP-30/gluconolactonase/LRE family protein, partial [Anaerolineae bacterium]|nr:SMP-30/gluconolactonase/LRE family protein [Anaerolineae bacterium]
MKHKFFPVAILIVLATCGNSIWKWCAEEDDWKSANENVIEKHDVDEHLLDDIPESVPVSNLKPGVVTSIKILPVTEIAPGIHGRMYWGRENLITWLTLESRAEIPKEMLPGEHIMMVIIRLDYFKRITKSDEAYHAIIPEEEKIELIYDGSIQEPRFIFTEGPSWMNGKLYVTSNWYDNSFNFQGRAPDKCKIICMNADGSNVTIINEGEMFAGTFPMVNGNLAANHYNGHRVVEMTPEGNIARTLASEYMSKPISSPNDLVCDARGGIYFTAGDIFYIKPDGTLTMAADTKGSINGVILSPDGKTLYVAITSNDKYLRAYDVNEDGTLFNGRKFAELHLISDVLDREGETTLADGMTVDITG